MTDQHSVYLKAQAANRLLLEREVFEAMPPEAWGDESVMVAGVTGAYFAGSARMMWAAGLYLFGVAGTTRLKGRDSIVGTSLQDMRETAYSASVLRTRQLVENGWKELDARMSAMRTTQLAGVGIANGDANARVAHLTELNPEAAVRSRSGCPASARAASAETSPREGRPSTSIPRTSTARAAR